MLLCLEEETADSHLILRACGTDEFIRRNYANAWCFFMCIVWPVGALVQPIGTLVTSVFLNRSIPLVVMKCVLFGILWTCFILHCSSADASSCK